MFEDRHACIDSLFCKEKACPKGQAPQTTYFIFQDTNFQPPQPSLPLQPSLVFLPGLAPSLPLRGFLPLQPSFPLQPSLPPQPSLPLQASFPLRFGSSFALIDAQLVKTPIAATLDTAVPNMVLRNSFLFIATSLKILALFLASGEAKIQEKKIRHVFILPGIPAMAQGEEKLAEGYP